MNEAAKPIIYVFSNVEGGGAGLYCALAEDGKILATANGSNESEAMSELNAEDCYEVYKKHCPGGYTVEFIPASRLDDHEGLHRALEANQKRAT